MRTIEQMISTEVHYCVSSLVSTLATGTAGFFKPGTPELSSLCEQAMELGSPVDDWESAAREAEWKFQTDGNWSRKATRDEIDGADFEETNGEWCYRSAATAQDACELDEIEPYQAEVYEHWIVSEWLADKLIAEGEKVDKDFAGLIVWARQTTGQAIYADGVIERIYAATHTAEVA